MVTELFEIRENVLCKITLIKACREKYAAERIQRIHSSQDTTMKKKPENVKKKNKICFCFPK